MITKEMSDLKRSLVTAIEQWGNEQAESEGWGQIGYVGELHTELIAEAAFNVILTIQNTNKYFEDNFDLE